MTTVSVEDLALASATVGDLIAEVRPEQWKAPTACTEWNVREVVRHLVGMDLVFTAMLEGGPMPERGAEPLGDDPVGAYRASSAAPQAAFARPEVLERSCRGPLGSATGAERLQIRLYDLHAHGSIPLVRPLLADGPGLLPCSRAPPGGGTAVLGVDVTDSSAAARQQRLSRAGRREAGRWCPGSPRSR
ncbi:maleylpyruvate isomerase family mycothiol-dependent enzyme [Streptomyces mirabilis]|uniref:maleylpyruvate isomerase family mycothiol-dependent enzyme n=1 Tax=Streptomyces mirabilis TaxID=68239 RepID=UPI0036D942F6